METNNTEGKKIKEKEKKGRNMINGRRKVKKKNGDEDWREN